MSDSVFDFYEYRKLPIDKLVEVDQYIINEILNDDAELLKKYNQEFLVYKVNKYIEDKVKELQPVKKKVVRKAKKPEVKTPDTPANTEEEKEQ